MSLVTGCALASPEIEATSKGEQLRDCVARRLVAVPPGPPDLASS